jgi:hypothetical protein
MSGRAGSDRVGAGVQLGEFDGGVLAWLAGFEPQQAQVIADIVRRAAETATLALLRRRVDTSPVDRELVDGTGMAAPHRSGSGHSKIDAADQPLVDL